MTHAATLRAHLAYLSAHDQWPDALARVDAAAAEVLGPVDLFAYQAKEPAARLAHWLTGEPIIRLPLFPGFWPQLRVMYETAAGPPKQGSIAAQIFKYADLGGAIVDKVAPPPEAGLGVGEWVGILGLVLSVATLGVAIWTAPKRGGK